MIRTARQLKDLVRNMSKGDSAKAQVIIRNYVMHRFLERLSLSEYRAHLILKGGILVSDMVGLDNRSTMDVDTSVKHINLSVESARKIVEEICDVVIDDGINFLVRSAAPILDEAEYSGVRVLVDSTLDQMRTVLKIDFSTGDVITPGEVAYSLPLLFEERAISILAYNLETLLAEKLETVLSRGTANTRMRDFYDLYVLEITQTGRIDHVVLNEAFSNTSINRGSYAVAKDADLILHEIENSAIMSGLWENYRKKFDYANDLDWLQIMQGVKKLCRTALQIRD